MPAIVEPPSQPPVELEPGAPGPSVPPSLATREALAIREAFRLLKGRYGDGGRSGWRAVGAEIGQLQEVILGSPQGFQEFLAVLDGEEDAGFLEALLHHLPLGGGDTRQGILESGELHEEVWSRYEAAASPERRSAFLRFFAYARSLSSSRMDDFLQLAQREPDRRVRQLAIDAIASNRDLLSDTWEVLAHAAEHDVDSECRQNALQGLVWVETEGARTLVKAAFSSPDERVRAAVLSSAAGDRIPDDVSGGDAAAYLIAEFRASRSREYKNAILKRFVGDPRQIFVEEIRDALGTEKDMGIRKGYNEALREIEGAGGGRGK